VGAQIDARRLSHGRRLEPVGGRDHAAEEHTRGNDRVRFFLQVSKPRQRMAEQPLRLLDDTGRVFDSTPAQPALDEVRLPAREPRKR
jgi:hypothetical protein